MWLNIYLFICMSINVMTSFNYKKKTRLKLHVLHIIFKNLKIPTTIDVHISKTCRYIFYRHWYSVALKLINIFTYSKSKNFLDLCPWNLHCWIEVSLWIFTWFRRTRSIFMIKFKAASGRGNIFLQTWR